MRSRPFPDGLFLRNRLAGSDRFRQRLRKVLRRVFSLNHTSAGDMADVGSERDATERASWSPSAPPAYCAVIGPSGAGKTNLILSFVRACTLPSADAFQLRLRHMAAAETLFRRAAAFTPYGVPPAATDDIAPYEFEVDVSNESPGLSLKRRLLRWRAGRFHEPDLAPPESTVSFKVIDGPGGDLFPTAGAALRDAGDRGRLLREAEMAQSLVICINAASAQSQTVRSALPLVLSELSGAGGSLRFARVLLLLTQIDRAAVRFLDAVQRRRPTLNGSATWATRYFCEHPQATAQNLCHLIDPLSLARDLLDDAVLHNLWLMMGRGRKLGIGICSAWGFDAATGAPFVSDYSLAPPSSSTANWVPFGIREALYFLLNSGDGRDRSSGPIREFVKDRRPTLPMSTQFEMHLEVDHP